MSDFIIMSSQPSELPSESVRAHASGVAVSLWFDMQADADAAHYVPQWARTLAQAHVDQKIKILAHPSSAYAESGLVCHVVKGALWPDVQWQDVLMQAVTQARAQGAQHIVLMLPSRTSPVIWTQWMLLNLGKMGAWLDHTTGLIQGKDGWAQVLSRPDGLRWLMMDRVITYGTALAPADYLAHMRAFNPLAQWIHDTQVSAEVLLQGLNAYHPSAPLSQIALKSDDLSAWNANKVVYFSTSSAMARAKVMALLAQWRQKYSDRFVRMFAVIRVQETSEPLVVNSIHHLWVMDFVQNASSQDVTESRFWFLGRDIDATALRAELLQCGI